MSNKKNKINYIENKNNIIENKIDNQKDIEKSQISKSGKHIIKLVDTGWEQTTPPISDIKTKETFQNLQSVNDDYKYNEHSLSMYAHPDNIFPETEIETTEFKGDFQYNWENRFYTQAFADVTKGSDALPIYYSYANSYHKKVISNGHIHSEGSADVYIASEQYSSETANATLEFRIRQLSPGTTVATPHTGRIDQSSIFRVFGKVDFNISSNGLDDYYSYLRLDLYISDNTNIYTIQYYLIHPDSNMDIPSKGIVINDINFFRNISEDLLDFLPKHYSITEEQVSTKLFNHEFKINNYIVLIRQYLNGTVISTAPAKSGTCSYTFDLYEIGFENFWIDQAYPYTYNIRTNEFILKDSEVPILNYQLLYKHGDEPGDYPIDLENTTGVLPYLSTFYQSRARNKYITLIKTNKLDGSFSKYRFIIRSQLYYRRIFENSEVPPKLPECRFIASIVRPYNYLKHFKYKI